MKPRLWTYLSIAFFLTAIAPTVYKCSDFWASPRAFSKMQGTILCQDAGAFRYVPGSGKTVWHNWPSTFQPEVLCMGQADTFLIWSGEAFYPDEPIPPSLLDIRQYFYKFLPLSRALVKTSIFNDATLWCRSLDFDLSAQRYLCVAYQDGKHRLLLFNDRFEVVRDLTNDLDNYSDTTYMNSAFFCDGNIIVNHGGSAWYYPFKDDSVSRHTDGILGKVLTVSHDKKSAFLTDNGNRQAQKSFIVDVATKKLKLAVEGHIFNPCFSPDDRFVAMTEVTYNIRDDVRLKVLEIATNKLTYTGVLCWDVSAWIKDTEEL